MTTDPFRLTAEFNRDIVGIEAPPAPTRLSPERKAFRADHFREEDAEYLQAETIEDETDALVDGIYLRMGALYEMGLDGMAHFMEVHRWNMRRVRGSSAKRPGSLGHDAVKPDSWAGPDHAAVMSACERLEAESTDAGNVVTLDLRVNSSAVPTAPRIILVGHGRHGKDTVAELLAEKMGLRFVSSSLFCAEQVMMPAFKKVLQHYKSAEACFADRHGSSAEAGDHRTFWFETIRAYCSPDKARLAREIFEAGNDMYVGIRDRRELWAAQLLPGVMTVWVDASDRLPPEQGSSMNIEPWMADVVLDNNGTLEDLERQVDLMIGRGAA